MAGSVHILYFAWLRERTGRSEETLALPEGVSDVAGLVGWLGRRDAGFAAAFKDTKLVRCAVNQEFATPDAAIAPGDEIAFFPPVTGG
jgi:molybdopterin synthase sulfur carrier subunit